MTVTDRIKGFLLLLSVPLTTLAFLGGQTGDSDDYDSRLTDFSDTITTNGPTDAVNNVADSIQTTVEAQIDQAQGALDQAKEAQGKAALKRTVERKHTIKGAKSDLRNQVRNQYSKGRADGLTAKQSFDRARNNSGIKRLSGQIQAREQAGRDAFKRSGDRVRDARKGLNQTRQGSRKVLQNVGFLRIDGSFSASGGRAGICSWSGSTRTREGRLSGSGQWFCEGDCSGSWSTQ